MRRKLQFEDLVIVEFQVGTCRMHSVVSAKQNYFELVFFLLQKNSTMMNSNNNYNKSRFKWALNKTNNQLGPNAFF